MKKLTNKEFEDLLQKKVESCGDCNDGDLSDGSLFTAPYWCSCPQGRRMKTLLDNMTFSIVFKRYK